MLKDFLVNETKSKPQFMGFLGKLKLEKTEIHFENVIRVTGFPSDKEFFSELSRCCAASRVQQNCEKYRIPSLVAFLGFNLFPRALYFEYIGDKSITNALTEKQFGPTEKAKIVYGVAAAVASLVDSKISCCLFPKRVLLTNENEPKLKWWEAECDILQSEEVYRAPEGGNTPESLAYSLGMFIWMVCTGKNPVKGSEIELDGVCNPAFKELIESLIKEDPAGRLPVQEALKRVEAINNMFEGMDSAEFDRYKHTFSAKGLQE